MVKKIPKDDRRAQHMSSDRAVSQAELADFVAGKHRWVLATTRRDGRPQMSLVTGGMTSAGQLMVSSYPGRAKVANVKANPAVSVLVLGDEFNDEWVQIDGTAEALDMPDAADGLVEYYRCISGEHPDWDEYRAAMIEEGRLIARVTPHSAVGQIH